MKLPRGEGRGGCGGCCLSSSFQLRLGVIGRLRYITIVPNAFLTDNKNGLILGEVFVGMIAG